MYKKSTHRNPKLNCQIKYKLNYPHETPQFPFYFINTI